MRDCVVGAVVVGGAALGVALAWLAETRRALARAEARKQELGLELMRQRNALMHTDASLAAGRHPQFALRSSDVAIVTFPKCGTTWMQAIVQGLRSNGALDFDEICEEIPWDILALDCGQDLAAEQRFHPRAFKSHEPAHTVARGGRYIYVSREPGDALVSFFHFLPSYAGLQPGDVSLQAFADAVFSGVSVSGQIWHHMLGWWARRADADVLWVCFEDLKEDLHTEVGRVADFLGLSPGPARDELVARVAAQCTHGAMSAEGNAQRFDDHFVRSKILPRMLGARAAPRASPVEAPAAAPTTSAAAALAHGSSAAPRVSKVRRSGGKVGYGMPAALRAQLAAKWASIIGASTGLRDYAHMRETLRSEREARTRQAA